MAVKKRFPYRAAFVACGGGCNVGGEAAGSGAESNARGKAAGSGTDSSARGKAAGSGTDSSACGKAAGSGTDSNAYGNVHGGMCRYGCIGCGRCVEACRFGAVSIGASGIAKIDEDKCIACGKCVKECPQKLIRLHECGNHIIVKCSNKDKGKDARAVCPVSCIGCGICEKTCTAEAVKVIDHCAVIDERYCLSCGMCAVKCPRHAIIDLKGIL